MEIFEKCSRISFQSLNLCGPIKGPYYLSNFSDPPQSNKCCVIAKEAKKSFFWIEVASGIRWIKAKVTHRACMYQFRNHSAILCKYLALTPSNADIQRICVTSGRYQSLFSLGSYFIQYSVQFSVYLSRHFPDYDEKGKNSLWIPNAQELCVFNNKNCSLASMAYQSNCNLNKLVPQKWYKVLHLSIKLRNYRIPRL